MLSAIYYKLRLLRWSGLLSMRPRMLDFLRYRITAGGIVFCVLLAVPVVVLGYMSYFSAAAKARNKDLTCLALNVYHEARGEPLVGQHAVAEVTLNRVTSERFPDSICEVVYEKRWDKLRGRYVGAFSWTEIESSSQPDAEAWQRAWEVAEAVYSEHYTPTLEGALYYHSRRIRPSWARTKKPVARVGRHVFYKEAK